MISSTLGIWTYTIDDHHFNRILSGLVNFVTPKVFPVKNDRYRKLMGDPRLCSSIIHPYSVHLWIVGILHVISTGLP